MECRCNTLTNPGPHTVSVGKHRHGGTRMLTIKSNNRRNQTIQAEGAVFDLSLCRGEGRIYSCMKMEVVCTYERIADNLGTGNKGC